MLLNDSMNPFFSLYIFQKNNFPANFTEFELISRKEFHGAFPKIYQIRTINFNAGKFVFVPCLDYVEHILFYSLLFVMLSLLRFLQPL